MTPITLAIVLAFLATVVVLITGISSMAYGGKFDQKNDTRFMALRVGLQAATIILVLAAIYAASS